MYETPEEAIAGITMLGGQPCAKCVANPKRSSPARPVTAPMAILDTAKSLIRTPAQMEEVAEREKRE
jgi:hypothetical protein